MEATGLYFHGAVYYAEQEGLNFWSTNSPLIDIFLYSSHLSVCFCFCKEKFCLDHLWELKGFDKS